MRQKTNERILGNIYISNESKKRSWQRRSKGRAEEMGGEAEADTSQTQGPQEERDMLQTEEDCLLLLSPYHHSDELLLAPVVWRGPQEPSASLTSVSASSAYPDYHFLINFLKPCFHLVIPWLTTLQQLPLACGNSNVEPSIQPQLLRLH